MASSGQTFSNVSDYGVEVEVGATGPRVATATLSVELYEVDGASGDAQQDAAATAAEGRAQWLLMFWAPTLVKKHEGVAVSVSGRSTIRLTGELLTFPPRPDSTIEEAVDANHELELAAASAFSEKWRRAIAHALKKADVDDLGHMDAPALLAAIPVADSNGRGLADMRAMERELGVMAAFCFNGHVLLVGPKAKLARKCFGLRNLLSHYHWRLSGREMPFEAMTSRS